MRLVYLLVLFMLLTSVNAQIFANFCPNLFAGADLDKALANTSNYSSLISISVLLVLMVLTILGIVYAIGVGFGIDQLKRFSRTELAESIFNLAVIAVIASGLGFASGAISFLSSLTAIGANSLAVQGGTTPITSNTLSLYTGICNNYINNGVETMLPYVITTAGTLTILGSLQKFELELEPNYFGFAFSPFAGLSPVVSIIGTQLDFFMLIVGVSISMPIFLYMIYFLFPIFLYVGILLRSFPWTRPAGGSMLALFIAFYIVFPALLYPFSLYATSQFQPLSLASIASSGFSLQALLTAIPIANVFGNPMVGEISSFANAASQLAVQLLGVVIALMISLDLVEALGDLLGAPSLHTKKLLSKVI